ncbi:MAG: PIN domain-containing protein [Anaerolineae bacterium]
MSIEFISRIIGMVTFSVMGWRIGDALSSSQDPSDIRFVLALSLAGAALGLLVTPWITLRPYSWFRHKMRQIPASQLVAMTLGLIIGLIIAALTAFPLSLLPEPWRNVLPFVALVVFGYVGAWVMMIRERDIFNVLGARFTRGEGGRNNPAASPASDRMVLLDTSVIIDGRIADVSRTGFVDGVMTIPRFVLNELQHIADSPDALRRNRGRRGLEMLNKLQKESVVPIRISDLDAEDVREVDDKLIRLAKNLRCPVLTNDYNLNKVAELQGVRVLNINELANAVRAVVLPGENMHIRVVQEGKELGQGVAYLDDGTMVVVENGRKFIGSVIDVTVTRMLQTNQGRMIFAAPANDHK